MHTVRMGSALLASVLVFTLLLATAAQAAVLPVATPALEKRLQNGPVMAPWLRPRAESLSPLSSLSPASSAPPASPSSSAAAPPPASTASTSSSDTGGLGNPGTFGTVPAYTPPSNVNNSVSNAPLSSSKIDSSSLMSVLFPKTSDPLAATASVTYKKSAASPVHPATPGVVLAVIVVALSSVAILA